MFCFVVSVQGLCVYRLLFVYVCISVCVCLYVFLCVCVRACAKPKHVCLCALVVANTGQECAVPVTLGL